MYKTICITNRHLADDLIERIENALESGVKMVILREKDMTEEEYEKLAIPVIDMCREHEAKCVLHSFQRVAHRLNHPHIHLTYDDFCALSDEECVYFKTIGVSTHSVAEAEDCEELGASYITISPIFPTQCKPGAQGRGLEFIEEVKESVFIPVYALGGIHPDNAQSCIDAGADGVCMMSEFMMDAPVTSDEDDEAERYSRQTLVEEIGEEGQAKLKNAKVLVVGAGGLGSPILQYLAGAGVGTIGIVDFDTVSISNLHRQVIHPASRVGVNKAESAKETMREINNNVEVITYQQMLTEDNAEEIFADYDFVLDAVDNFDGKFLINDTCVKLRIPFCHAGVIRFEGQVLTWVPGHGPCFRCIFEDIPEEGSVPTSSQVGIMGPIAGAIGCLQALEAIKYITGAGELLTGRMLIIDGLTMKSRVAKFSEPREDCPACRS